MHPAKALHTAARRYCVDRGARLLRQAILERWRHPERQGAVGLDASWAAGALRGLLRRLEQWGRASRIPSRWCAPASAPPGMVAAAAAEWERLCRYVRTFPVDMLPAIEPLGFRRHLSPARSRRVRAQLAAHWGIAPREHYWYPLQWPSPPDAMALQSEYCYLEVPPVALQDRLYRHGVTKVWVVAEFGPSEREPDRELDTDRFDLAEAMGGGVESYAASKEDDWLIYVSHEHSITFVGAWLVEAVQEIWPSWPRRIYTDYAYTYQMHAAPELQAADDQFWFHEAGPADG